MKFLMAIILASISTIALSCPNLTGSYQCYDEEYGYTVSTVTQTGSGSKTVYNVEDDNGDIERIAADNKWVSERQEGQLVHMKAYCNGKKLMIDGKTQNPHVGAIRFKLQISLDARGDMVTSSSTTVGGQNYPAETSTCTKI